jgi:hypothetical protein
MNNPGLWYGIVAFVIWIVVTIIFYDGHGKLVDFIDDAAGPALLIALFWPVELVLALIFAAMVVALSPAYIVYIVMKHLVSKGSR